MKQLSIEECKMFPSAHFFSTIILYLLVGNIVSLPPYSLVIMLAVGVGIDLDIFLKEAHRKLPTHSIFLFLIAIPFIFLGIRYFLLVFVTISIHLVLDSLDWEVYLFYPLSKKSYGINMLQEDNDLEPGENSVIDFVKYYFSDKKILILETFLASAAILLWVISFLKI